LSHSLDLLVTFFTELWESTKNEDRFIVTVSPQRVPFLLICLMICGHGEILSRGPPPGLDSHRTTQCTEANSYLTPFLACTPHVKGQQREGEDRAICQDRNQSIPTSGSETFNIPCSIRCGSLSPSPSLLTYSGPEVGGGEPK